VWNSYPVKLAWIVGVSTTIGLETALMTEGLLPIVYPYPQNLFLPILLLEAGLLRWKKDLEVDVLFGCLRWECNVNNARARVGYHMICPHQSSLPVHHSKP
jgi:hypothetical protein